MHNKTKLNNIQQRCSNDSSQHFYLLLFCLLPLPLITIIVIICYFSSVSSSYYCLCFLIPMPVKTNTPFVSAVALQHSSRNCSPDPHLVFFQLMVPRVFFSGGVFLFTDAGIIVTSIIGIIIIVAILRYLSSVICFFAFFCMGQDSSKGGAVDTGCSGSHYTIGCFIT